MNDILADFHIPRLSHAVILDAPIATQLLEKETNAILNIGAMKYTKDKVSYLVGGKFILGEIEIESGSTTLTKEAVLQPEVQKTHGLNEDYIKSRWPRKQKFYVHGIKQIREYPVPVRVSYPDDQKLMYLTSELIELLGYDFSKIETKDLQLLHAATHVSGIENVSLHQCIERELIEDRRSTTADRHDLLDRGFSLVSEIGHYAPRKIETPILKDNYRILTAWYASKKRNRPIRFEFDTILGLSIETIKELVRRKAVTFHPTTMRKYAKQLFTQSMRKIQERGTKVPMSKLSDESMNLELLGEALFLSDVEVLWNEFIKQTRPSFLKNKGKSDLSRTHLLIHQIWKSGLKNHSVVNAHIYTLSAYEKQDIQHPDWDDGLDTLSDKIAEKYPLAKTNEEQVKDLLDSFPDVLRGRSPKIYLIGGRDLNIGIKSDCPDDEIVHLLTESLHDMHEDIPVQFLWNKEVLSTEDAIPLYNVVYHKVSQKKEKLFARREVYCIDDLWKWASQTINQGVFVGSYVGDTEPSEWNITLSLVSTPKTFIEAVNLSRGHEDSKGVVVVRSKEQGKELDPEKGIAIFKNLKELNVIVLESMEVKDQPNRRRYLAGVGPIPAGQDYARHREYVMERDGELYAILGRTYSYDAVPVGSILTVTPLRIKRDMHAGRPFYAWEFPRVASRISKDDELEDTRPKVSSLARIMQLSELGEAPEGKESLGLKECPHKIDKNICPLYAKVDKVEFPIKCEYASVYVCSYIKNEYYGVE